MIVYGSSLSPYVRKLLAYLSERGLEAEVRAIRIGDPDPDFRRASPFGKMPALVDGDVHLADSSAIVHYLEAKIPDGGLIPADPAQRGKCIWYEEFADTILTGCGGKMFFNRIVAPLFLKREGDPQVADTAEREELPKILDYLESVVPGGDGFLVGDSLTLADLAVASPFANLKHLKIEMDGARWPKTLAYAQRILARPSFAPLVEKEAAFLDKIGA